MFAYTSTAGMNPRQRRRVVERLCERAKTLCTVDWDLDASVVWRAFAGRRGGFELDDVINFITLGNLIPIITHGTGEDLRLRMMLKEEMNGGELWMPKRKRSRMSAAPAHVPHPFEPQMLIDQERERERALQPMLVEDDDDDDDDLALAIRLSLEDERIRQYIETPSSPAQHIPEEDDDDDVLAFSFMRVSVPQPVTANDDTACLLCSESGPVFRVTQCCEHKYCLECIRNTFKHAEGLPRCPDCVAHGQRPVSASIGIHDDARTFMDPYCIKAADPDLCHSRHLAPFLNMFNRERFTAVCPLCETTTYGSAIRDDRNCCRCPNLKCALLFCRACAQPYHGIAKCKAKVLPTDASYLANKVRRCPVCSETIQHFRNHGCHHVTCPSCSTELCYACGHTKEECDAKPFRRRCPIFCNVNCGCPDCEECRPGHKCTTCTGCKICGVTE